MDTLTTAEVVGVTLLRGLILLAAATAMAVLLRRAPARRRATLWSLALVGTLLIPIASSLLPALHIPALSSAWQSFASLRTTSPGVGTTPQPSALSGAQSLGQNPSSTRPVADLLPAASPARQIPWNGIAVWSWALVAGALLLWQAAGLLRLRAILKAPTVAVDPDMQAIVKRAMRQVAIRRSVTVAISDEVAVPVTWGLWRPVVLLPPSARSWLPEKLHVVLLHELVHIREMHWPLRTLARITCALYWCNPLTWWARTCLIVDQELATDEEVLRLGSTPSTYASHLLEVARATPPRILAAGAALELARRQHLEGRIMAILDTKKKLGLAATIPILLLMASLVPAIAAVQPWSNETTAEEAENDVDLKAVLEELRRTEEEMQPILERFEDVEANMQPYVDAIKAVEIDMEPIQADIEAAVEPIAAAFEEIGKNMEPLHLEMQEIDSRLQPYLEQVELMQKEMEPVLAELENLDLTIDLGDGANAEFTAKMRELEQRLQPMQERLADIQVDMAPIQDMMEEIQTRIEPYQRDLERLHEASLEAHGAELEKLQETLEPRLAEIEKIHDSMQDEHLRLSELEKEMAPFHERLSALGRQLERGLHREIEQRLRSHLEAVTEVDAPFDEAADRIMNEDSVHIDNDVLRLDIDPRELRQMLDDLFAPHRRSGTGIDYPAALDAAVADVVSFRIAAD